ncbi:hypothetical protein [Epilithonimonas hispanica]|uniref:Uncharacterized protein n=1 Tax=Epilithonimonas hispanica TaxID=358687 RepID=A0A3D9CWM8_9FLAO|nr:hypothetical protein [Epilithonimonas hispanica]REC70142.1 hypothetical protein DRF58_10745 [Epilithonimonas hispanica]
MKKRTIFFLLILIVGITFFFLWFHKDKELKSIPKNADAVVLIDVKELKQQYFLTFLKNPFIWFGDSKIASKNNGLVIPDYIQIFHLKDSNFAEWYSFFEIKDKNSLIEFLIKKGFKISKNNIYTKDSFSIKIEAFKCVVGFSNPNFETKVQQILNSKNKLLNADQLINNSVASVSYFAKSKIHKFAIYLNEDNIEIKTKSVQDVFSSQISDLDRQTQFLKMKLDSKNAKIVSNLFNDNLRDSIDINSVSAISELESVNDKIVSYAYDDDFNEVEKVSYQKLVQPSYKINVQSPETEKVWSYFQDKKWINADDQFTAIPFQPNLIEQKGNEIIIKSLRKPIESNQNLFGNYFFLKNSQLFETLLGTISKSGLKTISDLDYVFYGNKENYYYLKLKFKKEKLPILLR